MNARRSLQARSLPTNAVIGLLLGIIALIASAIVLLLLLRLNRQLRIERRAENQIDLLGAEGYAPSIQGDSDPEKALAVKWRDKPLPPVPSASSRASYMTMPDNRASQVTIKEAVVVRRPSHTPSLPGNQGTTGLGSNPRNASKRSTRKMPLTLPTPPFPTNPTLSGTSTTSSIGNALAYESPRSGIRTSRAMLTNNGRGQLAIANATDDDRAALDGPQVLSYALPPYMGQVRGRDAPFPSRRPRPNRLSIMPSVDEKREQDMTPSVATREKRGMADARSMPATSYMVQVPIPQISQAPASPLLPQRVRQPLTLTTSRPVSNVIVENVGSVRRPDGSRSKGRMVTMSVLVDDSDSSSSAVEENRRDSFRNARPFSSRSAISQDVLGEVLERYATDLPPYTPVHEDCNIPQQ